MTQMFLHVVETDTSRVRFCKSIYLSASLRTRACACHMQAAYRNDPGPISAKLSGNFSLPRSTCLRSAKWFQLRSKRQPPIAS